MHNAVPNTKPGVVEGEGGHVDGHHHGGHHRKHHGHYGRHGAWWPSRYYSYWRYCHRPSYYFWGCWRKLWWYCYDWYYWPYDCSRSSCFRGYSGTYSSRPTYATFYSSYYSPLDYPPQPCAATLDESWGLLADGRAGDAYDAFDCLVETSPDDGVALVGLGLTAAALGQDEEAVRLVRAAARQDPAALLYVPADERLDELIRTLADRFDDRARQQHGDMDALFMVAALRYLLNDDAAAHYSIEIGITIGDADPSAVNLRNLIEKSQE